jgi:hypothetical protein
MAHIPIEMAYEANPFVMTKFLLFPLKNRRLFIVVNHRLGFMEILTRCGGFSGRVKFKSYLKSLVCVCLKIGYAIPSTASLLNIPFSMAVLKTYHISIISTITGDIP